MTGLAKDGPLQVQTHSPCQVLGLTTGLVGHCDRERVPPVGPSSPLGTASRVTLRHVEREQRKGRCWHWAGCPPRLPQVWLKACAQGEGSRESARETAVEEPASRLVGTLPGATAPSLRPRDPCALASNTPNPPRAPSCHEVQEAG